MKQKRYFFIPALLLACTVGSVRAEVALNGEGTEASPYLIGNADELNALRQYTGADYAGTHFALTADIDLKGTTWQPVGDAETAFHGQLHGECHVIRNLVIDASAAEATGLFARTAETASIDRLGLVSCRVAGGSNTGALVGLHLGTLTQCYVSGSVQGTTNVGGMAGANGGVMADSYSLADVTGTENVGGMTGYALPQAQFSHVAFTHLYAAGRVTGEKVVGGFVGFYAKEDIYTSCYFDRQRTGQNNAIGTAVPFPSGMTGKSSTDMYKKACYTTGFTGNWDFDAVWALWEGNSYPYFRWQAAPAKVNPASLTGVAGQCPAEGFEKIELCNAAGDVLATVTTLAEDGTWSAALQGVATGDVLHATVYREGLSPSYPASTVVSFTLGQGTEADPFTIGAAGELANLRNNLGSRGNGVHFALTADIDLSETGEWTPIGTQQLAFYNHLDGRGHVIRNMRVVSTGNYAGLFAQLGEEASVKNLHILNADVTGNYYVGLLAGGSNGIVTDCSVYGRVQGSSNVGGLVGQHQGTITGCYAAVAVDSNGSMLGGLVGNMPSGYYVDGKQTAVSVTDCYAHATVSGTPATTNAGGLIGNVSGWLNTVASSYAEGWVTEGNASSSGALIGGNSSDNIGWYNDMEYPCYANADFSSLEAIGKDGGMDALAETRTTAELQQQSLFLNWDFENTWRMVEGGTTPYLAYQSCPPAVLTATPEGVTGSLFAREGATVDALLVLDRNRRTVQTVTPASATDWSFVPEVEVAAGDTLYVVACERGLAPSMAVPVVLGGATPPTAVDEVNGEEVCRVYPTLAVDRVTIDCPAAADGVVLRITDASGKTVCHTTTRGTATVDVASWAPGLYFVQTETAAGRSVRKFVKR